MEPTQWTRVLSNATVATCVDGQPGCGLLPDGAVAMAGRQVAWVGATAALPGLPDDVEVRDLGGALVTPGLIDCHTHLVFAGNRAQEFALRQRGASYEEIALAGGGIAATVAATRAASEDELAALAVRRARVLLDEGVTTIEIKSGYGLDRDNELKLLRAARAVGTALPFTVHTTLLAAHAVPPEFAGEADSYVAEVVTSILPAAAAAGLADSVDAFCERIAFSAAQVRRVFEAAVAHGLPVRLHAEQLSNSHGAALAAGFGALSADHLEYLDDDGAIAMARAGTVAVLLPGAFYYLGERQPPPVGLLRSAGVPIALASDYNPGSSPLLSLRLAMNMGCVLFGLSPDEALLGVTRNAARALGLAGRRGSIQQGAQADLVVWDAADPAALAAQFGAPQPAQVFVAGQPRG